MNKAEYIYWLEQGLSSLSMEEKTDAIQYYSEYFDESELLEEETAKSLGKPSDLAKQILVEAKVQNVEEMPQSAKKGISAIWVVILAIFAVPIAFPFLIAAAAVIFAILISLFTIVFSLLASGVLIVVAGIVSLIFGIIVFFVHIPTSILMIGMALIAVGLGVLLFYGMYKLGGLVINGTVKLAKSITGRNKK